MYKLFITQNNNHILIMLQTITQVLDLIALLNQSYNNLIEISISYEKEML